MPEKVKSLMALYRKIIMEDYLSHAASDFKTYAVTNVRGGIGKTTLAFNMAYGLAQKQPILLADLCAQKNFTDLVFTYGSMPDKNINDAFVPAVLGPAFGEPPAELAQPINKINTLWEGVKDVFMISGGNDLYNWPSALYCQMSLAASQGNAEEVRSLLYCLKNILEGEAARTGSEKVILDTSPFYAGGTHLAWCAADALIVPVMPDKNSLDSLSFLFRLLSDPEGDYLTWNKRAEIAETPKIAALVMTQVGISNDRHLSPSDDSMIYMEKIMDLTESYRDLFVDQKPEKTFAILEDLDHAGRLSQAEKRPIKLLDTNRFSKIVGYKIVADSTVLRYKNQMDYLVSML
jgi:cellulose biosynthesis protein BcsQ